MRSPRAHMPKLYVLSSNDIGRNFAITDGATLGREPGCTIVLRDASISRKHARFESKDGAWRVVDTGSRNGLHHGGARVEAIELADGLEFVLGDVSLRFRADVNVASAPARSAAPSEPARPVPTPAPPDVEPEPRVEIVTRESAPASESEEIVLEGSWDEAAAPRAPEPRPFAAPPPVERASASAPAPELERTQLRARSGASAAPPAGSLAAPRTPPGRGVQMRAPDGRGGAAASRALLQYQRVHDDGRTGVDLAQLPVWLKLVVAAGALALFAGVFWIAFQGTAFFKGKVVQPAAVEDEGAFAPDER